jgi:hypothetical protein
MIVRLTQGQIETDPYRVWNEFIGIIASEASAADPIQRPAHLVFVYESEVQNGGHLQFFENGYLIQVEQTIASLHLLGARCQATVLEDAAKLWITEIRGPALSLADFVERALEERFSEVDLRFSRCSPNLLQVLEHYLDQFRDAFVHISDP